jgi:hypothetical protein
VATEVKGIFSPGFLIEILFSFFFVTATIRSGRQATFQQIVFIDQCIHLRPELVGGSDEILWEIWMVVFRKDAPAFSALAPVEQEPLVVVAGGHASDLDLLNDAIQVPFVSALERDDRSARCC